MRLVREHNEGFTRGGDPYKKMGLGRHGAPLQVLHDEMGSWEHIKMVSGIKMEDGFPTFDAWSRLCVEGRNWDIPATDMWSIQHTPDGDGYDGPGMFTLWYMNVEGGIANAMDMGTLEENIEYVRSWTIGG